MIERGSNADDTAKSPKHKSKKRGRDDDTKTSVSMQCNGPKWKGKDENCKCYTKRVQNGKKVEAMSKRNRGREAGEGERTRREPQKGKSKEMAIRERDRGLQLTEEEHTQLDREEKVSMARKGKAAIDPETKMAPLTAFFASMEREEEEANSVSTRR
eukprot:jgi/Picsp_1/779/NSC_04268-R1_---NA---